ncbi:13693_t:CDS:1, partial [Racocetra fulgida]
MAQEQLERKIYEITKNIPSGSLSVEEGIKEARKNKTILEAAKR